MTDTEEQQHPKHMTPKAPGIAASSEAAQLANQCDWTVHIDEER